MKLRIFTLLALSSVFALSACSNGGGGDDKGNASSQPSSAQSSSSSSSSSSVATEKGGTFTLSLKEASVTRDATGETLTVPVTGVQSGERTIE